MIMGAGKTSVLAPLTLSSFLDQNKLSIFVFIKNQNTQAVFDTCGLCAVDMFVPQETMLVNSVLPSTHKHSTHAVVGDTNSGGSSTHNSQHSRRG